MEILPAEDVVVGATLPRFTHTEGIRAPHLLAGLAGLVVEGKNETIEGMKALRPVGWIPSLRSDELETERPREDGGLGEVRKFELMNAEVLSK
jgi:hypothetical protein